MTTNAKGIPFQSAPAPKSLQEIPPLDGYIPVFIRKGDTPLEEINLQLAEAFKNLESKSAHQKSLSPLQTQLADISKELHHKKVGINNAIHKHKELIIPVIIQTGYTEEEKKKILKKKQGSAHIQKIPKRL